VRLEAPLLISILHLCRDRCLTGYEIKLLRQSKKEIEQNKVIFYDKTVADACLRLFREKEFKLEGT
jgi:hypothetical protein